MNPTPTRPVLRWHGGKWLLAPWIISFFPKHRVYVEPFGGAASVLLRKERAYAEIYNDLDHDVVNLFRVLREPEMAPRLIDLVRLTPFARAEFRLAYEPTDDAVERARRLITRSFMGFGSNSHASSEKGAGSTGFRSNSNRSGTTPAHDWAGYPSALAEIVSRFTDVVVENRDAMEVLARHDSDEALHYVDPPYVHETRSIRKAGGGMRALYRHELDRDQHVELLQLLRTLRGAVVLSGYPDPLYDRLLEDWSRFEREALADGARPRTEVVWVNPACMTRLRAEQSQLSLLDGAA